jgi:hypothetical protein
MDGYPLVAYDAAVRWRLPEASSLDGLWGGARATAPLPRQRVSWDALHDVLLPVRQEASQTYRPVTDLRPVLAGILERLDFSMDMCIRLCPVADEPP